MADPDSIELLVLWVHGLKSQQFGMGKKGRGVNQARDWLLLACVCALLALPLSIAARGSDVLPGDAEITRTVQAWPSPALDNLAVALTAIGRS